MTVTLTLSVLLGLPWTEADKLILENVTKGSVRMVSEITGTYEENLKVINLKSLEDRRERYDLI